MSRQKRKREHLRLFLEDGLHDANFEDITLVHNCLPGSDPQKVSLGTSLAGLPLKRPFFINALTGGVAEAEEINRNLAEIARECELPMAVGSQMAALEKHSLAGTFKVVRQVNPQGIIFANIGAYASEKMAQNAVEMIEADCLQLHLNVPQELAMDSAEGDICFSGYLERIERITSAVNVPVIVKEVGFGIAKGEAEKLLHCGVSAVDVGGRGGTNFIRLESQRSSFPLPKEMQQWGIPTPISIVEALAGVNGSIDVIASGGVNTSLNIIKALALGAKAVGVAGMPLQVLLREGKEALKEKLSNLQREIMTMMIMLGAHSIADLQIRPLVISGQTAEWLTRRGIDINWYARRG